MDSQFLATIKRLWTFRTLTFLLFENVFFVVGCVAGRFQNERKKKTCAQTVGKGVYKMAKAFWWSPGTRGPRTYSETENTYSSGFLVPENIFHAQTKHEMKTVAVHIR